MRKIDALRNEGWGIEVDAGALLFRLLECRQMVRGFDATAGIPKVQKRRRRREPGENGSDTIGSTPRDDDANWQGTWFSSGAWCHHMGAAYHSVARVRESMAARVVTTLDEVACDWALSCCRWLPGNTHSPVPQVDCTPAAVVKESRDMPADRLCFHSSYRGDA